MRSAFDEVIDRRGTNSLKWSRYAPDVLPLWVADMDFPAPAPVREALHSAIEHGVFGYELCSEKLQAAVAERMLRLYNWRIDPEMVLPTPGIVAGFNTAARAVCAGRGGVLIQPPVYHPFFDVARDSGQTELRAPLRRVAPHEPLVSYEVDYEAFEHCFSGTLPRPAMFLLCHPHNPTGQVYSRQDLERMAELCLRHQTIICSDEVHSELLLGGTRHLPFAAIDPAVARQSITLVSPSKTFNLVGLFCGFAIIPDATLRSEFNRALQSVALHVNSLGLIAAQVAFSGICDEWLARLRDYLTANRDFVVDFTRRHLPGVKTTLPDATYLCWMDFSGCPNLPRDRSPYRFLLEHAKVALNPGEDFGPGGEGFVRFNFGCPRATLEEALCRIQKSLEELPGGICPAV